MDSSSEELEFMVLLGAFCVGGAIVGFVVGMCRRATPWPKFLALMFVAFVALSVCTTVSASWTRWSDYDKGIRASIESAKEKGYEVRRSGRSDGTVVYEIKNYIVPDGSYTIVANRSPFSPDWSLVAKWSLFFGLIAAFLSVIARGVALRVVGDTPACRLESIS